MDLTALPGGELIRDGLAALSSGQRTETALLILIGAIRLRKAGVDVPHVTVDNPEHALYELLAASDSDSAHSRYNALIRQLVSFERAVECVA